MPDLAAFTLPGRRASGAGRRPVIKKKKLCLESEIIIIIESVPIAEGVKNHVFLAFRGWMHDLFERLVLGAQRESGGKLGMWEYQRIEICPFMKVSGRFEKDKIFFSCEK